MNNLMAATLNDSLAQIVTNISTFHFGFFGVVFSFLFS